MSELEDGDHEEDTSNDDDFVQVGERMTTHIRRQASTFIYDRKERPGLIDAPPPVPIFSSPSACVGVGVVTDL